MIYLERDQLQALRTEARATGVSLAELIRRIVERHLEGQRVERPVLPSIYLKIVGLGSSGAAAVAEEHDRYLGEAIHGDHAG